MAKPSKKLTDPTFEYVCAAKTDIRKLFQRMRKQLEEEQRRSTVHPLKRTK